MARLVSAFLVLFFAASAFAQIAPNPYDRVLLPIAPRQVGWVSELWLYNDSDVPSLFYPYFSSCLPRPPFTCPPRPALMPHISANVLPVSSLPDGVPTPGIFFYVESGKAPAVSMDLRLKSAMSPDDIPTTALPIVPESRFYTSRLQLLHVPFTNVFPYTGPLQQTLRIYQMEKEPSDFLVRLYADNGLNGEPDKLVAETRVTTRSFDETTIEPRIYPTGLQIHPLSSIFPGVGYGPCRVEIEAVSPAVHFWAFVSVTNTANREVLIIAPGRGGKTVKWPKFSTSAWSLSQR